MTVGDAEDARVVIIIIMTVGICRGCTMMVIIDDDDREMMTMISDGYDEDPYLYLVHI